MEKISLSPILQGKECEKTVLEVVSLNKAPIGALDRERRERDTARERKTGFCVKSVKTEPSQRDSNGCWLSEREQQILKAAGKGGF